MKRVSTQRTVSRDESNCSMKPEVILIAMLTVMVLCINAFAATDVLVDDFEGSVWNANWSGAWIQAGDQIHGGTASAKANPFRDGMFTTVDIDTAGATAITVEFWFRKANTDRGSDFFLYYFDGSAYNQIADLDGRGADNTWLHYTHTITDSSYFKSNFRVRFEARNLSGMILLSRAEYVWIDDFKVSVESSGSVDNDADGYPSDVDCNDEDTAIHPGAREICGDGIDQNCDGVDPPCLPSTDTDNDGYDDATDCNDFDRNIHPGAQEVCGDGVDQNCDGSDLSCGPDNDGDGYGRVIDCDDGDVAIHPGAVEICGDGIDQNCSGADLPCAPSPPSCVYNLGNWKIKYKQKYSDCRSCHTTCTPGGHSCTVGESWGSSNCVSCHTSAHF